MLRGLENAVTGGAQSLRLNHHSLAASYALGLVPVPGPLVALDASQPIVAPQPLECCPQSNVPGHVPVARHWV